MYFPNSQIKTNLYTNGDEYILSTTKERYKGYYYKLANGKIYTGKSPNDKPNILLIIFSQSDNNSPQPPLPENYNNNAISLINDVPTYSSILPNGETQEIPYPQEVDPRMYPLNDKFISRLTPLYNPTRPIQKDYDLGVFQRYFCKKNNELIYIEIDKTTFQQLNSNNPQIAWDLYSAISLNWYLTGDKSKTYNANKGLSTLIETQQKWHGFSQYFKENYSKYYQSQDINDLYTSGGEFTTKNRQNYIGFYHIHNGITPMVGKTHINTPHDVLLPTKKSQLTSQTTSSMMLPTPPTITGGGGNYSGGGSSMGGGGSY